MEKYSAFRDPGTGIQPFLTPVPASGDETLQKIILPLTLLIGAAKTLFILLLGVLYVLLVYILCLPLIIVPQIHRAVSHFFTSLISRTTLLVTGLWWIPVEVVSRKRGRGQSNNPSWRPQPGDIIVSNWVSWIEILWLAFRFDPIFVLPVCEPPDSSVLAPSTTSPVTHAPGRRTGTGSAAISSPPIRTPTARSRILGFKHVSLLSMLRATGSAPPFFQTANAKSLEDIRRSADRPVVVFPECTTSNGRGLLRFAPVFQHESTVPVKGYNIFVMCVRYDPPTTFLPTLSHSIPSQLNPLFHVFSLASTFMPLTLSIRLLALSESPSSNSFTPSSSPSIARPLDDQVSEACADLIANVGKMKRTGVGWEDKVSFLEFYIGKPRGRA